MRSWLTGTVGLISTAVVLFICFALFAVKLATRSHPKPFEETDIAIGDTVTVWRNSFGVPHIVGVHDTDVVKAQAWVHAQDRLWQMDMYRRIGRGTLAEVVGTDVVAVDIFMRGIDIPAIVRQQMSSLSPSSRKILEAYAAGVNAYLKANDDNLPFEFDALGYEPEPWRPEDCLIVGRVLAFQLSLSFWTDLAFAQIAAQRGLTAAVEYVPRGRPGEPTVLDSVFVPPAAILDSSKQVSSAHTGIPASVFASITSVNARIRTALGIHGGAVGSNAWAVSRKGSGALVANDPHLSLALPASWYQIHLTSKRLNVVGMSIPGLPLVFSGRNDDVAWGLSNVMVDDVDYFVERVDSSNTNYYFDANKGRMKFRYRRDTIRIRGQADSLIDLRFTSRSAVISDVHLARDPRTAFGVDRPRATSLLSTTAITFRWTARNPSSDEILALYRCASARSLADVKAAFASWYAPAMNVTAGSKRGDVVSFPAGLVPVRGSRNAEFINPGWDPQADWKGSTHLSVYGSTSPGRKFVVAANNRLTTRTGPFVGNIFEPASRAERIAQQLGLYDEYGVRDAQVMQMDMRSPYAEQMVRVLLPVLKKGYGRYGPLERTALDVLKQWDGTFSPLDPGAAIFAVLQQRLVVNTFEDELGAPLFGEYAFVSNVPTRRIQELLDQPNHELFDDIRTQQREDAQWIIIRSFVEACQEIRMKTSQDDPRQWDWGVLHRVTLSHSFSSNPLLKAIMDQGPFEIGGTATTINNTEWRYDKPYDVRVGASMRIINDLNDSIQYAVVPGGVSGQPLDAHYSDQVQLWLKGGYIQIPVKRTPDISFQRYHVFLPL